MIKVGSKGGIRNPLVDHPCLHSGWPPYCSPTCCDQRPMYAELGQYFLTASDRVSQNDGCSTTVSATAAGLWPLRLKPVINEKERMLGLAEKY